MLSFDEIQQNFLVWKHRKGPDCTGDLHFFVHIFFYTLKVLSSEMDPVEIRLIR
jgi:hypothetical protein